MEKINRKNIQKKYTEKIYGKNIQKKYTEKIYRKNIREKYTGKIYRKNIQKKEVYPQTAIFGPCLYHAQPNKQHVRHLLDSALTKIRAVI